MKGSQIGLRVICVILMIIAIVSIITGVALLIGATIPPLTSQYIEVEGKSITESQGALIAGLFALVNGMMYIFIASLGLKGAKNSNKIGGFFFLSILGLILAIITIVQAFIMETSIAPITVIQFLVIIVCVFLSYNIRKGNKQKKEAARRS